MRLFLLSHPLIALTVFLLAVVALLLVRVMRDLAGSMKAVAIIFYHSAFESFQRLSQRHRDGSYNIPYSPHVKNQRAIRGMVVAELLIILMIVLLILAV